MVIALYKSHHELPFWHEPTQPKVLFDESKMASYNYVGDESIKDISAKNDSMWPILLGLEKLQVLNAMAHVSFIFNDELKTYSYPKRVWVQITTIPPISDLDKGIPLIIKNEKINVVCLWGHDNKTHRPWGLLTEDIARKEQMKPEFWTTFFKKKIYEQKNEVKKSLAKAENEVAEIRKLLANYVADWVFTE